MKTTSMLVKTIEVNFRMIFHEAEVKRRIVGDLKDHIITVRHVDGLYRHWRCQKPGDSNMAFDVITWPGSLCYTGDMGHYLFKRTDDMVAFMRGSCMSYGYAAEKCISHDGRLKEWREEEFNRVLTERLAESKEVTVIRHRSKRTESVAEHIATIRQEYSNYSLRADAEKAMCESGLWDGGDMPSCEVWSFHFLWCLHAIKWFCDNVDHCSKTEIANVVLV